MHLQLEHVLLPYHQQLSLGRPLSRTKMDSCSHPSTNILHSTVTPLQTLKVNTGSIESSLYAVATVEGLSFAPWLLESTPQHPPQSTLGANDEREDLGPVRWILLP